MPIQRDISPELQSMEVCHFLKNQYENSTDNKVDAVSDVKNRGFEPSYQSDRQVGQKKLTLPIYQTRKVKLLSPAGRLIRDCEITDVEFHPVNLEIYSTLYLKTGIDKNSQAEIESVFNKTPMDGDEIEKAEQALSDAGISNLIYEVILYYSLVRDGQPRISSINYDNFLKQMRDLKDDSRNSLYVVVPHGDGTRECEYRNVSFPDDEVLEVGDVEKPHREVEEEAREKHRKCEGLEITDHRIGTAFQIHEFKIEWEMRDVRVGRCRIMRTKLPILYSRVRKYALWGMAMTRAETKRNAEKAIEGCLILAAVNTAALAIVTGGLGLAAAVQAFVASAFVCLETKISDVVTCFFVELKLVSEDGDWHEGI